MQINISFLFIIHGISLNSAEAAISDSNWCIYNIVTQSLGILVVNLVGLMHTHLTFSIRTQLEFHPRMYGIVLIERSMIVIAFIQSWSLTLAPLTLALLKLSWSFLPKDIVSKIGKWSDVVSARILCVFTIKQNGKIISERFICNRTEGSFHIKSTNLGAFSYAFSWI